MFLSTFFRFLFELFFDCSPGTSRSPPSPYKSADRSSFQTLTPQRRSLCSLTSPQVVKTPLRQSLSSPVLKELNHGPSVRDRVMALDRIIESRSRSRTGDASRSRTRSATPSKIINSDALFVEMSPEGHAQDDSIVEYDLEKSFDVFKKGSIFAQKHDFLADSAK